jgi:hypothetical protein
VTQRWQPNPYPTRGHRHRWKITKDQAACTGYKDWFSLEDIAPKSRLLVRSCEDCTARQTASVEDESVIVKGYEAVSDCDWKDIL